MRHDHTVFSRNWPSLVVTICSLTLFFVGCVPSCSADKHENTPVAAAETQAQSEKNQAQKRIVFLGDSLTAGLGLSAEESFPGLIGEKIENEGLPWTVVNAGVSGDTTSGGVSRLDWIYKNPVDILFVCLGANDGFRGVPVSQIENNLSTIVERGLKENSKVILAGMQLPLNYGETYRKEFNALFERVANRYNIVYLPFLLEGVAFQPQFNQQDRIHPNPEGSKVIADLVWKFVRPEL